MTDSEIRELCNRFFDAYECFDTGQIDRFLGPAGTR